MKFNRKLFLTINLLVILGGILFSMAVFSAYINRNNALKSSSAATTLGGNEAICITSTDCQSGFKCQADDVSDIGNTEKHCIPTKTSLVCGPMDVNGDGKLDIIDFANFVKKYSDFCLDTTATYKGCGALDITKQGQIDLTDFAKFAQKYGSNCP